MNDITLEMMHHSILLQLAGRYGLCPFLSPSHCSFHPITPFRTYLPNFKPGAQNIVGVPAAEFNERGEGKEGDVTKQQHCPFKC